MPPFFKKAAFFRSFCKKLHQKILLILKRYHELTFQAVSKGENGLPVYLPDKPENVSEGAEKTVMHRYRSILATVGQWLWFSINNTRLPGSGAFFP
ncbi:hypothetical protein [Komagataeibacter swingsii]|uniref:hypothetical protein n=1 Tax=Komagataeibacter swingsii TaxID=215220 RepID=UPI00142E37F1|nr:hypothetical protein [Komagataeibacter swingsii]